MGLGVYDDTKLGFSEIAVPDGSLGNGPIVVCSVPMGYAKGQGQMDFIKRGSAGGEIYIGLGGKKCSSTQYDIVLNDTVVPFFHLDGLVHRDIDVLGSQAGLKLSAFIGICSKL